MQTKIMFHYETSTKGAHRFTEVNEKGGAMEMSDPKTHIGTMYFRKSRMGEVAPSIIIVTVDYD